MYIKSSLRPSERATGGPWYTDGELDDEFVAQIMNILFNYIRKKTFYHSSSGAVKKPKKTKTLSPEEAKALRDKSLGPRIRTEEEVEDRKAAKKREFDRYLPMPAGYQGYATLDEMTLYIDTGKFTEQILTANDVQLALDIMCYDDRIEKVIDGGADGVAYKALRKSLMDPDEIGSVITDAPCGRCPVFDLCEEGGPVGPSNCEYFNDWLNL
jgi:DNA-directed RNA polymerase III subunit RPC6